MKKKIIILGLFLIVSVSIGLFVFLGNNKKQDLIGSLININDLDKKYMDKYYNDMDKLLESNNRENILIVVSKKKPKDNYGATMVVSAPNNTYLLEYKNDDEKNKAKKKFEKDKKIYSVIENRKYEYFEDINISNSPVNYNSWGIEKSGLNHAIDYINQNGGENVTVAIIDSGCDMNLFNESFNGKIEEFYNLYDPSTYGHDTMFDHAGHGTHIAGTIAEGTPSNVKILPIKAGDEQYLDDIAILEAINYITDNHKADVINMSFGTFVSEVPIDPEYVAIEAARRENIISVAAAGNSNSDSLEIPGAYDNTISISAVDSELNKADFSSYNDKVDFAAPGVDILSINGTMSGTSMATPHAVSAVAFLKSIEKNLSLEGVINALQQNSIDLGTKGKDIFFGYGFIDLSSFKLCDDGEVDSCTNFNIEEDFIPTSMEIEEVVLTPYNYGSLTNLMPTVIKLIDAENRFKTIRIDKLDDVTISGYNPYAAGEQTVSIKYLELEKTFKVSNPDNYEIGWTYEFERDEMGNPLEDYVITGYKDNNLEIEKLYLPETVDNRNVISISTYNPYLPTDFSKINDAKYFKEVLLPSNIESIGPTVFRNFKNLTMIKSDADELEIGYGTFEDLLFLTTVDANITFGEYGGYAFWNNLSLKDIRLSPNTTIIPKETFSNCKFLKNIDIPEGVKEIGSYAFADSGIKSVDLPTSLEIINNDAFSGTLIKEVYIPQNVSSIGMNAFGGNFLEKVTVSEDNAVYDSRNNCNAIIESDSNTLIIGTNTSIIPEDIEVIATGAFSNSKIKEVEFSEELKKIEDKAFYNCYNLKKVKMPRSVNSISDESFASPDEFTINTIFYVYNSSYAHNYVQEKNRIFVLRDINPNPPEIIDMSFSGKNDYLPFETLDLSSYEVQVTYKGISEPEIIRTFKNPRYTDGRDSFRYNDWYAWLYFDTSYGYHNIEMYIPVEIGKLTPEYEIPTDVYANVNSTLADVDLPDGFEWEDNSILLSEVGDVIQDARYIPQDIDNYQIVENIAIPIHVIPKTLIKPTITVQDKEYDGTLDLPLDNVIITDIDEDDYSVIDVRLADSNAGISKALIKLKLSDEKFENYSFSNGKQEKVFKCDINILQEKLTRPEPVSKTYIYNGEYQTFLLNGFDSNKMIITGDKQKNAGEYSVILSLKNNNYIWDWGDGSLYTFDLSYTFTIEQADIDYHANDAEVIFDGEEHGLSINVDNPNAIIKYMDENGEYTLDTVPKYSELGTYVIKYMITIDDNYKPAYGENTLTIKNESIINNTEDFETIYDGKNHSINLNLNIDNYTVHYSVNNTSYNLNELPTFKNVGEYTINYKIDSDGYNSITGSNKVKIYGVKSFDLSIIVKGNNLVINDSNYSNIINKITTYSTSTDFIHLDKNNNAITSNKIKTGDIIRITINKTKSFDYKISLLGDVNGNSTIDIIDYIRIMKDIMGESKLVDVYFEAADMNRNEVIDIVDYIRIMKIIMEEN